MNTKEKAQIIANFYQKLADNNNGFKYKSTQIDTSYGPNLNTVEGCLQYFEVNPPKQETTLKQRARLQLEKLKTEYQLEFQKLEKFYEKLIENDNGFAFEGKQGEWLYPNLDSNLSLYEVNPPKPVNKIIDLSVCIKSGIDMEFGGRFDLISKLTKIGNSSIPYYNNRSNNFIHCRVRQYHWHSWQGENECLLPVGLIVILRYLHEDSIDTSKERTTYHEMSWTNVVSFKVTGIADGYRYGWMEE